jgi:hypothetical protein
MKKLALLALVALEICVCGCGNTPPTSTINTQSNNSYWEAQIHGGEGDNSQLDFVTSFSANEGGSTLGVNSFNFINQNSCFPLPNAASGNIVLITNSSDQVTGTLTFSVTGGSSTLTLNGTVTGTSNGSTTSTGNLTDGVVQGTWSLTTNEAGCTSVPSTNAPPFLMCQGAATCTAP